MHGSKRDKKTLLLASRDLDLSKLGVMCDGKHKHLPWGLRATAEERRYPELLCKRWAKAAAESLGLHKQQVSKSIAAEAQVAKGIQEDKLQQVFRELQPRRGRQELISQFTETLTLLVHDEKEFQDLVTKAAAKRKILMVNGLALGKETKVLDVSRIEVGSGVGSSSARPAVGKVIVGIPWSPEEFLTLARKLQHPFDWEVLLPPKIAKAIAAIAAFGPSGIARLRIDRLAFWKKRAAELEPAEKQLHLKLEPQVEAVVKDKKILLFEEMLASIHYDDMSVADLLITGIEVVGNLKSIGIWRASDDKLAKISQQALMLGADAAQKDS